MSPDIFLKPSPAFTLELQCWMMNAVSDQIAINKDFGEMVDVSDWEPVNTLNGVIQQCVRVMYIKRFDNSKNERFDLVLDFEPDSFIVSKASLNVFGESSPSGFFSLTDNWLERSLRSTCQSLFLKDDSPQFHDTQALVRYYSDLHPKQPSPLQDDFLLRRAVRDGNQEMVGLLIDVTGILPDQCLSKTHGGLLHFAVMSNSREDVSMLQMLIDKGCDLESVNAQGCTPLLSAARNGHAGAVTCLLEAGASSLAKDLQGVGLVSKQSSKEAVHAYRAWAARQAATQSLRLLEERNP